MVNGIYPQAIWLPGPEWKTKYPWPNDVTERTGKGTLYHSVEGRKEAAFARLFSNDQVSWTGTVAYDGTAYQHYPCWEIVWHGGGPNVNCRFDGWEFEGRAGEPLTTTQIETAIALTWWKSHEEWWPYFKHERETGTMLEHNWFFPTSCPSGRIPFSYLIERLNAMATEDNIRIVQLRFMDLILDRDWQGLRNLLAWLDAQK
jgi:hypothetical protein